MQGSLLSGIYVVKETEHRRHDVVHAQRAVHHQLRRDLLRLPVPREDALAADADADAAAGAPAAAATP